MSDAQIGAESLAPDPEVELAEAALVDATGRVNRGAFRPGDDPRRVGGQGKSLGRPRREVIAKARASYEERLHILEQIADGKPLPFVKRVALAGALLSKDGATRLAAARTLEEAREQGVEPNVDKDVLEIRYEESANIDQRIKAIEDLGKFGHVHMPLQPSELADPVDPDAPPPPAPVFLLSFD